MRIRIAAVALWFVFLPGLFAQRIWFGVVGGTGLTSSFSGREIVSEGDVFGNPASRFQWLSGSRSLIFGAMIEVRISDCFSVEANVLRRPLNSTIIGTVFFPQGTQVIVNRWTAVKAWEFPILFKYTMPRLRFARGLQPFLEAGPSIRTQEDAVATEPSRFGFSVGAGAAMHLGRIRLAPSLRYTRWTRESIYPRYPTKPDQIEFLTSVGYETDSESRRFGGHALELGVVGGLPITESFRKFDYGYPIQENFRFMVGLALQFQLHRRFGIEADAIYKPMRGGDFSVLTWQIPVLAKYTWTGHKWTPFAEAGPSFRLAGNLSGYAPSHYGATFAGGLERRSHGVRLSPALRYTRWAPDGGYRYEKTNPNALELVLGISF